jgi:hypothetical protein
VALLGAADVDQLGKVVLNTDGAENGIGYERGGGAPPGSDRRKLLIWQPNMP